MSKQAGHTSEHPLFDRESRTVQNAKADTPLEPYSTNCMTKSIRDCGHAKIAEIVKLGETFQIELCLACSRTTLAVYLDAIGIDLLKQIKGIPMASRYSGISSTQGFSFLL